MADNNNNFVNPFNNNTNNTDNAKEDQNASMFGAMAGAAAAANGAEGGTEYEVQSGDSLSKIGERHGVSWREIFEANRDTISDPDLIHPGQKLKIPASNK